MSDLLEKLRRAGIGEPALRKSGLLEGGNATILPLQAFLKSTRLRQSTKPLMNKLETDFFEMMKRKHPGWKLHPQAITLRIGNGIRIKPDFFAITPLGMTCWETKGKWVDGDSFGKLKMAATTYPEITFWLAWREGRTGSWEMQRILP